jgi:hypothetical protein
MPGGTLVQRHWVVVLHSGVIAVDWGDGLFQDTYTGEFLHLSESQIGHTAQNAELESLKHSGQIDDYDEQQVWFTSLPDRPVRTLD